jgi:hypothetical protein
MAVAVMGFYSWRLETMVVWVFYHSFLLLLVWPRNPLTSTNIHSHILTWNSLCMCVYSVEIQVWRRLEGMGIMEKWKIGRIVQTRTLWQGLTKTVINLSS